MGEIGNRGKVGEGREWERGRGKLERVLYTSRDRLWMLAYRGAV